MDPNYNCYYWGVYGFEQKFYIKVKGVILEDESNFCSTTGGNVHLLFLNLQKKW